ncbi:MAG: DUF368 domain-containing protein [Nanoarchaeota archaeon]|nr:DUF368 domain-containing protein [Nanoarchaeota archaeon]MBU1269496.1 DUF368 domain-containing protein [Nanoarchaeota archaeon]MBU1603887.1 DUF368 domain-containing protein [Nanoarchaeota archaeon]MBU2443341.1 DUF368 domain-containing protein [Nanoarchaeota archaeon]
MGVADIIPGVSGGTIALITGIYERLVHGISSINSLVVKEVVGGKFKKAFFNVKKIDFALFIPLLFGIAISFLSLSHLMSYLLSVWTGITYAFFFGLILSSAFFVYKHASKNRFENLLFLAVGFVFAFWFVGLKVLDANHSLVVIFFSAMIAICAMILPGISGSFMLLLLNQYEYMIGALKNLLFDKIIVFLFGALIGILSFSKVLDWLLKNHKAKTMSFLTGVMIGSLRLPWGKVAASDNSLLFMIIAAVVGFAVVFVLEKKFGKN